MAEQAKRASCIIDGESNVGGLTGKGVLVGIIDSGIEYSHREFRGRILYIWDMINDRVYTKDEIENGAISKTDTNGHGTAAAGIACGESGVAYESSIIAVGISRNAQEDIIRAIAFIQEKAREQNMPVAINISYGTNSGSHNGQSDFEQAIDRAANEKNTTIVVSSGNEGDKAHHYRGEGSSNVEFSIGRSIPTLHMELWKNFSDVYSYEILSPNGNTGGILSENNSYFEFILQDTKIRITINEPSPSTVDQSIYIDFEGLRFVNDGIWRINIRSVNSVKGGYSIWLPVSEGVDENTRFLSPETSTTLTVPSTAYRVITVGAYNSNTNAIAAFSGRGYTREVEFVKPDIVAPGVNIVTAGLGGGYTTFTGTSAAAPFVTGAAALLMEWGIVQGNDINMYGERLKAYLRRYASRNAGNTYPNESFGFGRLCFRNVYNNLLPVSAMEMNNNEGDKISIVLEASEYTLNRLESANIEYCRLKYGSYIVAYINPKYYESLLSNPNSGRGIRADTPLIMGLMDEALNDAANITSVQDPPLDLRGNGTLVAIIDTGINYNDAAFKYENGESKIYSAWVQDENYTDNGNICFGREYTNEEITRGNINLNDEVGHGTMLAKTVLSAAPDCQLLIVKLRNASRYYTQRMGIDDNVPAYESSDVMLGIDYAIDKAEQAQKPISILIALGTNEGSHDGQTFLEKYLLTAGTRLGVSICMAAGNEAISQRHTSFEIGEQGYYDVEINIGENVNTVVMSMWNNAADRLDCGIIPPVGEGIDRIPASNNFIGSYSLPLIGSSVTVEYRIPAYQSLSQLTLVTINRPVAGVWKIRAYGENLYSKTDCWLPIENFVKNISFLRPDVSSTVTVPGTQAELITVGAYDYRTNRIVPTSGRGPNRNNALRPDLAAPSTGATSISAAVTAAAAALVLQWGMVRGNEYSMNTTNVKALLIRGAFTDGGEIYPNNIWGYGKLDLYNTFVRI